MPSSSLPMRLSAILTAAVCLVSLTACAVSAETARPEALPSVSPTPNGSAYDVVPVPGRTIEAAPPACAIELDGQRIALVLPDADATTQTLGDAARAVAEEAGAQVEEYLAQPGAVESAFTDAVESTPDIVVGIGEGTADVFAYETAQWLDQQFLMIGAQLPEPTDNVTAVIWDGATSRGSGAPADGETDASTLTPARAHAAVSAGLSSLSDGIAGVVLYLNR